MQCANPDCRLPALDLSTGVLCLIELDVPPEERVIRSDGGFPVCSVPSRYFWLCPRCSLYIRVRRWTSDGVIFEDRAVPRMRGGKDHSIQFTQPVPHSVFSATKRTA